MKCPRCQQDNPPHAKFCLECALPLALRCGACGAQLPTGSKFCFECAAPVSAPGSPQRLPSPQAYTPKHLAERIINSKAALERERKQVTVLFADLKGSMELLVDRDPESCFAEGNVLTVRLQGPTGGEVTLQFLSASQQPSGRD